MHESKKSPAERTPADHRIRDVTNTCEFFIYPMLNSIRLGIIKPDGREISVAVGYRKFARLLRDVLGIDVTKIPEGVAPEPPCVGETWEWRDRGEAVRYKLTRYDGSRWYGIGPWSPRELPLSLRHSAQQDEQRFWRRIDT